ncbi:RNase H domain-containing protein [Trichonephila clavipes]|nr:RNase H domain-containing protein [Trichonephila clavipes]
MKIYEGRKSFEMCTNCSSKPATPAHILECLGLTKRDLADVPLLVLDFLKVYDVMDLKLRCSGSPVVKIWDHGRHVMISNPVPLKTHHVGQRCTLDLSRAETSPHWCDVVVRRGGASSGVVHVT